VYMPVVSARNVQAAPSYNWFLAFRKFVMEKDPDAVFYVLTPLVEDSRWQGGADWGGDRVHVLEMRMAESQFDDMALVTREFWELFNERFGRLHWDVLITEKPMLVPILKKLSSFHLKGKSRQPVIVSRDQFTVDRKWFKVDEVEELLQACGWVSAPCVFQSPHQAKRALGIARLHLKPHHLARMADQMRVFPLGVDCDDIDAQNMSERSQKNDKITVNYSHKLFLEQRFLESLKIMDSTLAGGRQVELQIVTGSSAMKMVMLKKARQYSYIQTYGGMNRSQFLRQMAKAHVFISNSIYEDFSATVVEQLYTGLVPVLIRADWSEYLVPDDYPYLFSNMDEGQAMLRYVVDNLDDVVAEWVPRIQEKVRAEFDLKAIVPQMVEWIGDMFEARDPHVTDSIVEVLQEAWDSLPDEFDLPMFYDAIPKFSNTLDVRKTGSESMATSPWLCVDAMLRRNRVVDLGTLEPSYRKVAYDQG